MILGVDVWNGYGRIDWLKAYNAGVRFAFIKCTVGNEPGQDDAAFARNVQGAKAAGIYVGGYHFPFPLPSGQGLPIGRSPVEQADRAFAVSGGLGMRPGELPHVVDAEWPEVENWSKWKVTARSISLWLQQYCERATVRWGRKPIIYTYPFWWRSVAVAADVSWARQYPLWIAHYTHSGEGLPTTGQRPIVPPPWDEYLFHQFSAEGSGARIPGIEACPVDRDVFMGSMSDLRRLALVDPDRETVRDLPNPPSSHPDGPASPKRVVDFDLVHPPVPLGRRALDGDE